MSQLLSLTSNWFFAPGAEKEGGAALRDLAEAVRKTESDTLIYLVHEPFPDQNALCSLPSSAPNQLTFFEVYRNEKAFLAHVGGENFRNFLKSSGHLFQQADGQTFHTVSFLNRIAGFVRHDSFQQSVGGPAPGVMVEILAKDQESMKSFYGKVFDWQYCNGEEGFAYVHYKSGLQPRLAGVGQSLEGSDPVMAPGSHFYLQVEDLEAALQKVTEAGGTQILGRTTRDGYTFAMFKDPEGNVIGLIAPFSNPQ
jgi:uncharacterized protein